MRAQNLSRLVTLSIFSFAVVVIGYTLISHAFDLFLYPDEGFRRQLYAAANINVLRFNVLVGVLTVLIVAGWVLTYYTEQNGNRRSQSGRLWLMFYTLVSREFYLTDLFTRLTRALLAAATRLNVWLRWV
jgi:NADH-quinone oxidoreductase subunit L